MIHYLTLGILLGLSAGFAPGPMLALVISETIQHGIGSGVRVALAPVVTDLPIVVLTCFILSKLSGFHSILGILALVGGCVIFCMGCECLRTKKVLVDLGRIKPKSLTRGIMANALSPHPYLFWFSVGAPTMTKATQRHFGAALAFVVGFLRFSGGVENRAGGVGRPIEVLSNRAQIPMHDAFPRPGFMCAVRGSFS